MSESQFDDTIVSRVAEAIKAAAVRRAEERVESQIFPIERIEATFNIARNEADRSASILLFALAEDLMLQCFKAHMNPKGQGGWDGLTRGNGLLATASDRISLLELLYWIRPNTGSDLRIMKSIRNRFAHHADVHSFDDKIVAGWISSMRHHEDPVLSQTDQYKSKKPDMRSLYLMRVAGALSNLSSDLAIGPIAQQERLHPGELFQGDFDSQPACIQESARMQARLMLVVSFSPLTDL